MHPNYSNRRPRPILDRAFFMAAQYLGTVVAITLGSVLALAVILIVGGAG